MLFPDIPGILLEKRKPIRITAKTTNRSLAQIARKRKKETPAHAALRRQAQAELKRRYDVRAKQPKKTDVAAHIGALTAGKKRSLDPEIAARLKDVSPRTIQAAVNRALAERKAEAAEKAVARKLRAAEKQKQAELQGVKDEYEKKLERAKARAKKQRPPAPEAAAAGPQGRGPVAQAWNDLGTFVADRLERREREAWKRTHNR